MAAKEDKEKKEADREAPALPANADTLSCNPLPGSQNNKWDDENKNPTTDCHGTKEEAKCYEESNANRTVVGGAVSRQQRSARLASKPTNSNASFKLRCMRSL